MAVCTHKTTTTIKKQCFGAATSLPFVTVVLPFLKRHLNVIIQYIGLCLTSLAQHDDFEIYP